MTVELVPDLPAEEEALRFGRLRLFNKSALHFKANHQKHTATMSVGSAAHLVLSGVAGKRVISFDRKTESGKAAPRNGQYWEKFKADNPDAYIVTQAEEETVKGMVASVRANRDAMRALEGIREVTRTWKDPMLGLCRGTPDVDAGPGEWIAELKTGQTADPHPWKFKRKVLEFSYHAQLAWYLDGLEMAGLGERREAFIVAVEQAPPYACTVFRLTESDKEQGRKLIRTWSEQLKACRESNEWPAYSQSIVDLDLPEADSGFDFGDGGDE